MIAAPESAKTFCNCVAQARGLDPVGHAGDFEDAIIVEAPLPWKRDMTQQAGALPQQVIDLLGLWLKQYYDGAGYPHRPLVIAPDDAYSKQGFRRVMFYTRPAGLFAQFDKIEYLIPDDEFGLLVWSLYEDRAALPRFDSYRVPEADPIRDILVCTHGTIDAACSKFGYPLYRHMRDTLANDAVRVWRVSHFGGHVFAPTLMDMPAGHYWAFIENEQAAQIVQRTDDVAALRGHYRGWAGMDGGFLQTAECELWQRCGWSWFEYRKSGIIFSQDDASEDAPQWADVRLHYAAPDDHAETVVDMRVEVSRTVETPHTTGKDATYAYPQYRVVE